MKTLRIVGLAVMLVMTMSFAKAQNCNYQYNQYPNSGSYTYNNGYYNQPNYNYQNNGYCNQNGYYNQAYNNSYNNGYYQTYPNYGYPKPRVFVNVNLTPGYYQGYWRGNVCHANN